MRGVLRSGFTLLFVVALAVACVGAHALPIDGSTSGTFENPVGPAGMVTTGVGSSLFTWGTGSPPSSLEFTGNLFSTSTETEFDIGTLEYYNGTIAGGTQADTVDLAVAVAFTTPSGVTETFDYTLQLINTVNTTDPDESADYVKLPTLFSPETFWIDSTEYTVALTGFFGSSGTTNISEFHVLEGATASAVLRGKVTSELHPVIPEASSIVLAMSGLASLAGFIRLKKRA